MGGTNIRNEIKACFDDRRRQLIKTVADSSVPERLSQLPSVSSVVRQNDIVIVTTSAGHGLAVGDTVNLAGADQEEYNANHAQVIWVSAGGTVFHFRLAPGSEPATPATTASAITAWADRYFREATILGKSAARTANSATAYLGWTEGDDTQPFALSSDGEVSFKAPLGARWNLADIWLDVTSNGDGAVILYS